jgi:hypothetical protein
VPRAALVHDDPRRREHRGDVAGPARVVEVDVRDHDRGQVARADPEAGQGVADDRRGRRGPRFHQARPVAPDQVARGDPVVPGHPGVDLEHLVPERDRASPHRASPPGQSPPCRFLLPRDHCPLPVSER